MIHKRVALLFLFLVPALVSTSRGDVESIAVGEQVVTIDTALQVTVTIDEGNGEYTVQDGSGNNYADIAASDLAIESGCSGNFCVAEQVTALDSAKVVTIIALESSGEYVVQDVSGNIYTNIQGSDLTTGPVGPHPLPPRPLPPGPFPQPPRPAPPRPLPEPLPPRPVFPQPLPPHPGPHPFDGLP